VKSAVWRKIFAFEFSSRLADSRLRDYPTEVIRLDEEPVF